MSEYVLWWCWCVTCLITYTHARMPNLSYYLSNTYTRTGAERHYTHSYATFLAKLQAEPEFACWLQSIETDLAALLTGPSWMGEAPAPPHR